MWGFILEEILTVLQKVVSTHHAWNGDLTQEEALAKLNGLREKLSLTDTDTTDTEPTQENQ